MMSNNNTHDEPRPQFSKNEIATEYTYIFDCDGNYTGRKIDSCQAESNGMIENYFGDCENLFFSFVDPVNYPKKLEGEEVEVIAAGIVHDDLQSIHKVAVLSIEEIDNLLHSTGIYDRKESSILSNSFYFIVQNTGGKLDTHEKFETGTLNIIQNPDGSYTAHDQHNTGNFIFGAASKAAGFSDDYVSFGSNTHARSTTFQKDSADDQASIFMGREYYDHFLKGHERSFAKQWIQDQQQAQVAHDIPVTNDAALDNYIACNTQIDESQKGVEAYQLKQKFLHQGATFPDGCDDYIDSETYKFIQSFQGEKLQESPQDICGYGLKEHAALELLEARRVVKAATSDNYVNHTEMNIMNRELGEALNLIKQKNNQDLTSILQNEIRDILGIHKNLLEGSIKLDEASAFPVTSTQLALISSQTQTLQGMIK